MRILFVLHDNVKHMVVKKGRSQQMTEIAMLEEHLNKIPSYQFLPSFSGVPRPVVFLEKVKIKDKLIHWCHSGLWKEVRDWCTDNNIQVTGPDNTFKLTDFKLTLEEFRDYVAAWNLNIKPRDYQLEAAWKILHYRQSMSQLATRAGKTLIAYIVFRYMLENGAHNILMIVPNITLVKQGVEDMKDYKEFFSTEAVWANGEYCEGSNLTIGTFQSLVRRCVKGKHGKVNKKYDPTFFDKFDVICVDETHKADCESIKQILSQPFIKNAKLRFGFSGTLPDPNTIESFGCQSMVGPKIQDISTTELVDAGFLAKPIINQIHIHYKADKSLQSEYIKYGEYLCSTFVEQDKKKVLLPKEQRDMTMIYEKKLPIAIQQAKANMSRDEYQEFLINLCKAKGSNLLVLEQMIAEHSQQKLDKIQEIIFSFDKNGIVFAHNDAYIEFLEAYYKKVFPERNIYKIKGSTSSKKRLEIITKMNEEDTNCVLIASFGVVSTGLTFKNIDYCVFAQSFRSKIITFQALGRGLLKGSDKTEFQIFDIIDILPTQRLARQGKDKIKMYKDAKLEYRVL